MNEIVVSISCTAFNHEKYIGDAIESFLMQKTDFRFEILIHDDASTDRTAEIIKAYEKQYPEIIKPIYQTENQYSRGIAVEKLNYERANGRYIAICEGDDYWSDPSKLQKQVEFMEKHPKCSLCVHGGYVVNAYDKKILQYNRPSKQSKYFTPEEIIEGGGGLFITNSMFFRTELSMFKPKFYENATVSDYPLAIYLSLVGDVYYMDENMSAYRVGDSTSWTGKNLANFHKTIQHYKEISLMLDELNQYTNFQYDTAIDRRKIENEIVLLTQQRKFKEIKKGKYKQHYRELNIKRKLILFIDEYTPHFSSFLRKNRRWLSGV